MISNEERARLRRDIVENLGPRMSRESDLLDALDEAESERDGWQRQADIEAACLADALSHAEDAITRAEKAEREVIEWQRMHDSAARRADAWHDAREAAEAATSLMADENAAIVDMVKAAGVEADTVEATHAVRALIEKTAAAEAEFRAVARLASQCQDDAERFKAERDALRAQVAEAHAGEAHLLTLLTEARGQVERLTAAAGKALLWLHADHHADRRDGNEEVCAALNAALADVAKKGGA